MWFKGDFAAISTRSDYRVTTPLLAGGTHIVAAEINKAQCVKAASVYLLNDVLFHWFESAADILPFSWSETLASHCCHPTP